MTTVRSYTTGGGKRVRSYTRGGGSATPPPPTGITTNLGGKRAAAVKKELEIKRAAMRKAVTGSTKKYGKSGFTPSRNVTGVIAKNFPQVLAERRAKTRTQAIKEELKLKRAAMRQVTRTR